jgi:hypothetical protein
MGILENKPLLVDTSYRRIVDFLCFSDQVEIHRRKLDPILQVGPLPSPDIKPVYPFIRQLHGPFIPVKQSEIRV